MFNLRTKSEKLSCLLNAIGVRDRELKRMNPTRRFPFAMSTLRKNILEK